MADDGAGSSDAARASASDTSDDGERNYLDDMSSIDASVADWVPEDQWDSASRTSSELREQEERRLALQEWEEGVYQFKMAFQLVLIPFFGKWLGRRWSYWGAYRALMAADARAFARWLQ